MPDILIINEGPVRKIRINRPEKKNALTLAMYEAMAAAIEDAATELNVRCLLISGAADIFCAGNDLNDFVAMAKNGVLGEPIVRFMHALARCEKPLVGSVSGAAVGTRSLSWGRPLGGPVGFAHLPSSLQLQPTLTAKPA